MNEYAFRLGGADLVALGSGGLWWPARSLLCVSDLHLGKSERIARRSGRMLPPYEVRDTLARLARDIDATGCRSVVCLGDSFDDLTAAQALPGEERDRLQDLMAARRWIWIEGNHDPAPSRMGGISRTSLLEPPFSFRHIAQADFTPGPAQGPAPGPALGPAPGPAPGPLAEVSGHYHPKLRLPLRGQTLSRPCFLVDATRLILPAYGTYTGGLYCDRPPLKSLMRPDALAILTGATPRAVPMHRRSGVG
ncbi:ligase-associated DNA damage response endonuclease PdeM [Brevirhabdus sp.]|uniref:ligase-associated DNA damage response endonuclease PdeM n=1 Tax=Brevirhabdus sp. TaxID=2004514 RepID=UPI0040585CBF